MVKIMICPKCQGRIELNKMFLTCEKCKLAFPIIENVPDMLIEDAWELGKAKRSRFQHNLKL